MKLEWRADRLMLIALLGAPLAAWLGGGSGPRSAVADDATPPAAEAKPQIVADAKGEATPSDYCVGRMVAPLLSMAGELSAAETSAPASGQRISGEHAAQEKWLSRVAEAADGVRKMLKTDQAEVVIESMIATIPDPIDSGLVYHFETGLQALRAGFERGVEVERAGVAGDHAPHAYFRDRSFLPWDDREHSEAQRTQSEECRTALPGVMLFRNSDLRQPRVLVVFLVGETPTSGVRAAALLNALRAAVRIDGVRQTPPPPAPPIRIIGPSYSGSAYSLRLTLERFAHERQPTDSTFRIISGTASGADVPDLLNRAADPKTGAPSLSYEATTVPSAAADCAYLWFLQGRLGVDSKPTPTVGGARVLGGVASLRESGTEFGGSGAEPDSNTQTCGLQPELTLSFPVHVSFLRDAYEDLDRRNGSDTMEAGIARSTSLGPALREPHTPLDVEANPSSKTRAALDVMLSNLLGEVSRRGVRHISIHATDVGDAIFLARKLRDVAPDVRIAFFQPDDILLHPQFRTDLLGSLVVSPYPFLGASDFRVSAVQGRSHMGFTNAGAQGIFNAVLAQRGVPAETLFDYTFSDARAGMTGERKPAAPLLLWVSTIARTGLVPLDVKPPLDCAKTIYGTGKPTAPVDAVCGAARELAAVRAAGRSDGPARDHMRSAWAEYNEVRAASLPIDSGLVLPRFWHFLYAAVVFGFFVDHTRQRRTGRGFAADAMPPDFAAGDERGADRAIGRTKWYLYAAIRTFLFVLALSYMGTGYLLAFVARDGALGSSVGLLFLCLVPSLASLFCWQAARQFISDYGAFARYVGEPVFSLKPSAWRAGFSSGRISSSDSDGVQRQTPLPAAIARHGEGWTMSLGLASPLGRTEAARVSFAQLRVVAFLTLALAGVFTFLLVMNSLAAADSTKSLLSTAVPMLTLYVLRNVPLLNGVSPATPALLCIGCVYVWAVGRMARLALAHGISRISPPDGEADLVSTPIRLLLYPRHRPGLRQDEGFTRAERDLLNSIWRPITGRYYVFACFAVIFFPIVLFTFKPLSTLEAVWGTWLLGGGLALSAVLIGVTLIQLIQYWICLERLLKRILAHRLGPAFARLPAFVRDSIDRQISRSRRDLLRWVACVRQFDALVERSSPGQRSRLAAAGPLSVDDGLHARMQAALLMADAPDSRGDEEIQLAECVVATASAVSQLLEQSVAVESARAEEVLQHGQVVGRLAVGCVVPAIRSVATPMERHGSDSGVSRMSPHAQASDAAPASSRSPDGPSSASLTDRASIAAEPTWVAEAEAFVATVVTMLIHRHLRQFRHFMSTLVATALLLLLTVTSYPFEPYRLLLTCIWVVVGSVVSTGLWVYLQLDRNTLLSLMSHTSPGEVTINSALVLRIVAWAVVPLLSVAAAQYPNVATQLFRIISPFAHALK